MSLVGSPADQPSGSKSLLSALHTSRGTRHCAYGLRLYAALVSGDCSVIDSCSG